MNTLKQHVQTVHEGVKPAFKCQVCDYTCYRKAQLERHMFEHDGDPFKCDLCQFSTKYKATIINHMKTHGPKNLMCELCDYATHSGLFKTSIFETEDFTQSQNYFGTKKDFLLKNHIIQHHTLQKEFKCEQCSYVGASIERLRLVFIKFLNSHWSDP